MILALTVICVILVLCLLLGLIRIVLSRSYADRMLAAQLFGTVGVAILLLLAVIHQQRGLLDVALVLALLTSLTLVTFIRMRGASDDHV